ncbi:thioredoxin 1 [Lebetimonas natsushimae]|uniref:Thioredoxin n=1 Tax=Lebetimonas natsushimae TaxID=1936991 RepID=A0A292YCB0_9BACT|nr:thioredoxin 1 [Lebetimonas natsushimae]
MNNLENFRYNSIKKGNQMALEITKENFEDIVKNNKLVVVDFWAPWCGPCRMVAPIIEELAEEYKDKGVAVGKINTDEQQELAIQFGIRSIPTVLFIKDGEVVDAMIGAAPKAMYEEKINTLLA